MPTQPEGIEVVNIASEPGGLIVSPTVAVWGLFTVPVAPFTVISPEYVPFAIPVTSTETVTLLGAVPLVELRVSQAASSVAVQVNVPVPPLVIDRVWLAGLTPAVVLKVKLVGLSTMLGPVRGGEI